MLRAYSTLDHKGHFIGGLKSTDTKSFDPVALSPKENRGL
jgi:hypothetical protein